MNMQISHIIGAILKIFILILLGGSLAWRKWTNKEVSDFLVNFLVKISVPSLVFSQMLKNSHLFWKYNPFILIGLSLIIFSAGFVLAFPIYGIKRSVPKKEFTMLVAFQNCGYLPMSLSLFLFPQITHQKFLVLIFVYLVGFNILMWSGGVSFLSRRKGEKFKLKYIFTPPVVGVIFSFLIVISGLKKYIPPLIIETASLVGNTTFVLSMVVLGIFLWDERKFLKRNVFKLALLSSALKLIALPGLGLIILNHLSLDPLLKIFIFIQLCMPSAASLPIVSSWAGSNKGFMASGVFLSHILSIFTIPGWLVIFSCLS